MTKRMLGALAAASTCWLTLSTVLVGGPQASPTDPFERVAFLIGRGGTSEGKPGKGAVQREYSRALNARFIHVHNRNVYPAGKESEG